MGALTLLRGVCAGNQVGQDWPNNFFRAQVLDTAADDGNWCLDPHQRWIVRRAAEYGTREKKTTETTVNALMQIFPGKAKEGSTATDARRKIRAKAQERQADSEAAEAAAQRVPSGSDAPEQTAPTPTEEEPPPAKQPDEDDLRMPGLEVTYSSHKDSDLQIPAATQDLDGPSQNTRAARRQRLLATVEKSGSALATQQAAGIH